MLFSVSFRGLIAQTGQPGGAPFALPKLIRNEYGGSIGGPVVLPTFGLNGRNTYNGRNRTFFFVSREAVALRQGVTKGYSVPTVAMRNVSATLSAAAPWIKRCISRAWRASASM